MKKYCLLAFLLFFSMISLTNAQSLDEMVENMVDDDLPLVTQPASENIDSTENVPVSANQPVDAVADMRQRIVELAESKVGTVMEKRGEDGCRIGWQNLKEFYESAYRLSDMETEKPGWLNILQTPGKKINDWCGIFATWAWRTSGLSVHWNTRLIGCNYRGDMANMGPGDLAIIKKEYNKYNHHCLIKSINGEDLVTIDGNQGVDSIKITARKLHHIAIYYSVADAMGKTPIPITPQPVNPGIGNRPPATGDTTPAQPETPPVTQPGNSTGEIDGPPITQAPPPANEEALKKLVAELIRQIRIALPFLW